MRRAGVALLALVLLGSGAWARELQGLVAHKAALVSGLRAHVSAKHAHISAALAQLSGGALTPAAVPAQCLSAAQAASAAGGFSVLLAAAEVHWWWGGGWRVAGGSAWPLPCPQPLLTLPPACRPLPLPRSQAAGLAGALSNPALQATVFAPTDDAFALALAQLGVTPEQLLAQPDLLAAVRCGAGVCGWGVTASRAGSASTHACTNLLPLPPPAPPAHRRF